MERCAASPALAASTQRKERSAASWFDNHGKASMRGLMSAGLSRASSSAWIALFNSASFLRFVSYRHPVASGGTGVASGRPNVVFTCSMNDVLKNFSIPTNDSDRSAFVRSRGHWRHLDVG